MKLKTRLRYSFSILGILAILAGAGFPSALAAKDAQADPFQKVRPPTSEWALRKVKKDEIEVGVKGKTKAVNVGLRIQKDLPISAANFLDQVRTKLMEDPAYQGAEVSLVQSQKVDGRNWDYFVIQRKDEIHQEFWARPLSSDQLLLVLYTAVGNYYEQYRNGLMTILQQVSGDGS